MDFGWRDSHTAWREEVRAFLSEWGTPTLKSDLAGYGTEAVSDEVLAFRRAMGAKGWRSLDWPTEYGGLGRGRLDVEILTQELEYAGLAEDDVTVTSIAPTILRIGSEQNKSDWLPGIRNGSISVALGYSEADAGTDLASLRTSATLDGDEWVINGSKLWNSGAHIATHEWLCVRTDTSAPAHRGISVIMVPLDSPGIEVHPITTWGDIRTNAAFFDAVRVPAGNLIGQEGDGWRAITGALHLERAAIAGIGALRRKLQMLRDALHRRPSAGFARLWAEFSSLELAAWDVAVRIDDGATPVVEAAALKIRSSEFRQRLAAEGMRLLGPTAMTSDAKSPAEGAFEHLYREAPLLRFGGGANEVLRDAIAQQGLGLPSSRKFDKPGVKK